MTDTHEILKIMTELIRETFLAPATHIDRDVTAADIPGWDSLSHTVFILNVSERFGVALEPETELTNLGEMVDLIARKLALANQR